MRSSYSIALSWFLLASACSGSPGTDTNALVFVTGSGNALRASYWTDLRTISSQKKWLPGAEALPVDLNHLIDLGRGELLTVRRITTNFLLDGITIRRIPVPRTVGRPSDASAAEVSNHWAVSLQFSVTPDVGSTQWWFEHVVLLFDGSIAQERFASAREIHEVQRGNIPLPPVRPWPHPTLDVPVAATPLSPAQTRSSRWRPGEPFPIDLSAAVATAASCVREKLGVQKALLLNELTVWGIEVTDSPKFPSFWGLSIVLHGEGDEIRTYDTVMLLDGRVVHCAETPTLSKKKTSNVVEQK